MCHRVQQQDAMKWNRGGTIWCMFLTCLLRLKIASKASKDDTHERFIGQHRFISFFFFLPFFTSPYTEQMY